MTITLILQLLQKEIISKLDEVEIFTPSGKIVSFTIDKLYDENNNPIDVARHPEEILKIYVPESVEKDSMMRVKVL